MEASMSKSTSALFIVCATLFPATLGAQCLAPQECVLPPPSCAYVDATNNANYGNGYGLGLFVLTGAMSCVPFGPQGSTVDDFFDALCSFEFFHSGDPQQE